MDNNKGSGTRKLLLKPASLKSKSENGSSENPPENGNTPSISVNNPFLKCEKDEPEKDEDKISEPATNILFKTTKSNLFTATSSALSDNSNFVFGENLHKKVVESDNGKPAEDNKKNDDGNLFSSVLSSSSVPDKEASSEASTKSDSNTDKGSASKQDEEKKDNSEADNNLSLVEAARKYEEMRGAQKRKYDEVEITTGEEDERNVLEINCKLFTFVENNYEERGRGILRLNDSKSTSLQSRLVFRASGSLRLLLNTKIWRDQVCEQPSQKSLRFTAFDINGVIKIYLVMGRVEDMNHLFRSLSSRIHKEKDRSPDRTPEVTISASQDLQDEVSEEPATKKSAACE